MDNEANILDRIAYIFDESIDKLASKGRCDSCQKEVPGGDIYCKGCAVIELRAMAKHLRQYL